MVQVPVRGVGLAVREDEPPYGPDATEEALQHALALYRHGDPSAAITACEALVAARPSHLGALRLLSRLLAAAGQPERAAATLGRVLGIQPDSAEALYSRGNLLQQLGRFDAALVDYDAALRVQPDFVEALNNRATTLRSLRRAAEAVESCERALRLRPDYARAWRNLGVAQRELARPAESVASLRRSLELEPDNALAWSNLSASLRDVREYDAAIASAERALAIAPRFAEAFANRGAVWLALRRPARALDDYERAAALGEGRSVSARAEQGRHAALSALKRHAEASAALSRALALLPEIDYGIGNLFFSRRADCDWAQFEEQSTQVEGAVRRGERADRPFQFLGVSDCAALQLQCARRYAADVPSITPAPLWCGERFGHQRLRVAYISPDFREHAVSYLLAGVVEHHDRSRFEITALSLRPADGSPMGERMRKAFDEFIEVDGRTDADIAGLLRSREIDIAVDLVGHTDQVTTILAHRPAPVQVGFLGYAGTMGTTYHDYIIADAVVIPPEQRAHYSEKVAYLPHSFQPNDSRRAASAYSPTRRECGLPDDGFVFCCFNAPHKFSPRVFDSWMRALRAVAGSVLWLPAVSESVRHNLAREAAARGVCADRLVFAAWAPDLATHLARYRHADLFLDTFPFTAHTTASEALWCGVPVLTRVGEGFAARVAASLLYALQLPELIVASAEDYERRAIELASDGAQLAALRTKLLAAVRAGPLFDTSRYTAHLEALYARMQSRVERGLEPADLPAGPDRSAT